MTSIPVYAQLATRVYAAERENRTPVPTGWDELEWIPDRWNGFSAGVYKNGNDIVIAFTGTNGQKAADFGWANLLAATGAPSPQVTEAMLLYFQVRQANPTANITFTGHSLGGGVATMMAIFFDRPATVFDAAPFELGARNLASLAYYKTVTAAAGYSDPAFDAYWAAAPTVFYARESQVTNTFLEGEFLESGRTSLTEIGTSTPVDAGAPTGVSAFSELHSMTLLAAVLTSSAFASAVRANASLIASLFNKSLYATDAETSSERDFLTSLYSTQVRATGAAPLLDRFAADLQRLGAHGMTVQPSIQKALIVAAMEYYYFKDAASAAALFTAESNGIHFRYSDIGAPRYKSLTLLAEAVHSYIGTGADQLAAASQLIKQDAWHIQSGGGGLNWTATDNSADAVVGGAGVDIIDAGAGNDILIGGAGRDFLTGGAGDDRLAGGLDVDTYVFVSTWGKDVVVDLDGQGLIQIDGQILGEAKAAGKRNIWTAKLDDGQFIGLAVYDDSSSSTGKRLVIIRAGDTDNTITIANFDLTAAQGASGYLGIKLPNTPQLLLTPGDNVAAADGNPFAAWDFDPNTFTGSSTTASAKSFVVYLNQAATAGATLVLHLGALAGQNIMAVLGDRQVPADGATITLAQGQTRVSFALIEGAQLAADATGALTVSLQDGAQSATSNPWSLTWKAGAEATATFNGDVNKLLNEAGTRYLLDQHGNFMADPNNPVLAGAPDVITGTSGADRITGLAGDDALAGWGGDDEIDGGDGADIIMGGLGADILKGGAGDDAIYGSSNGVLPYETDPGATEPQGWGTTVFGHGWGWIAAENSDSWPRGMKVFYLSDALSRDIQQGDAGNKIDGGDGNDFIYAGTGDDFAEGGSGNDQLIGMGGADVLLGGDGDDFIMGDGDRVHRSVTFTQVDQQGADFLDGGDGNDILYGQGRGDILFGGMGDDVLWGDDTVPSDTPAEAHGNDYLDGEDGNDTLIGGGKDDELFGGAGNDVLWGDELVVGNISGEFHGEDYLDGGDGNDTLIGGGKNDMLYGGAGNDLLYGDDTNATRTPEALHGDDYLDGGDGDDRLIGGGGADQLFGGMGNDLLWGDSAAQTAGEEGYLDPAVHGDDYLDGGEGDDQLVGGGGNDELLGGAGNDLLIGDASVGALPGEFHGNDYLDGGDGNDTLIGGGGHDQLFGGAGNDILRGDNESLQTDAHGNDYLDGEDGDDVLAGDGGDDTLYGGSGNDMLRGDDGNDELHGEDGNDLLAGGAGDDTLYGGSGDDELQGGDGNDELHGGDGNDTLYGEAGDDTLDGGAGSDYLDGGDGNDVLIGGGGSDILIASSGDDVLYGGGGGDTYVVQAGAGRVTIVDVDGTGVIVFGDGVTAGQIRGGATGDGSQVIQFAGGQTIKVVGQIAQFTFGDGSVVTHGDMAQVIEDAREQYEGPQYGTTITNLYDADENPIGSSVRVVGANGTDTTIYSGVDGAGAKLSGTWTTVRGGHGSDTFNADGSSAGIAYHVDGTYSTYTDGGAGTRLDETFSSSGLKSGDSWVHADGTWGSDVFHPDGSSSGVIHNADGTYAIYTSDGQGHVLTTTYDAAGGRPVLVDDGIRTYPSSNTTYFSDGSHRVTIEHAPGEATSTLFASDGTRLSARWTKADGSHGVENFRTDGSSDGVIYKSDGSYQTVHEDGRRQTIVRDYTPRGVLTGTAITEVDGLNSITTFLDAAGTKINETWVRPDGSAGSSLVGPWDFNGLPNLVAGTLAHSTAFYESWLAPDGAGGYYSSDGGSYSGSWWLSDLPSVNDPYGEFRSKAWTSTEQEGSYLAWFYEPGQQSARFYFDVWYSTPALAAYDPNKQTGSYHLIDFATGVEVKGAANLTGRKFLSVAGSQFTDIGAIQQPIKTTFTGYGGAYDIFEDDGQGNVILTGYSASSVKIGDMWFHNDGSYGVDTYHADGSVSGVSINPGQSYVRFNIDAQGNVMSTTYPGATATIHTQSYSPPPPVIAPPAPPPRIGAPNGGQAQGGNTTSGNGTTAWWICEEQTWFNADGKIVVKATSIPDPGYEAAVAYGDGFAGWSYYDTGLPIARYIDDGHGTVESFSYDAQQRVSGRTVAVTASDAMVTTTKYNAAGRLLGLSVQTHPAAGQTNTHLYDAAGRLTGWSEEYSDGHGNSIVSHYDAAGALLAFTAKVVSASGYETTFTHYDSQAVATGVIVTKTALDGVIQTDNYEASGRLTGSVVATPDGAGKIETVNYDASGAILSFFDLEVTEDRTVVLTMYDDRGRMVREDFLQANALHSNTEYSPDGSSITTTTAVEGHFSILVRDPMGNQTTTRFAADGTRLSDSWTRGDGSYGADTFNADGSSTGTATYADGRTSSSATGVGGDVMTIHRDAAGVVSSTTVATHVADETRVISYDPQGNKLSEVWWRADGSGGQGAPNESVANTNEAPIAVGTLEGWTATAGNAASYVVSADAFIDIDVGDTLAYSATLSTGAPLPSWLSFDAGTRTFSGTPTAGDGGDLVLKVTAVDSGGLSADQAIALHVHTSPTLNEGIDTVHSSITYTLPPNVENLILTGSANRNGTGNASDNTLVGNTGRNTLKGEDGNDTLYGGAGKDVLVGGAGNDTYVMARGYGADKIRENDATAGNTDVAFFGPDITSDQLWFQRRGRDLHVSVIGTSDKFTIDKWFAGSQYHVEQFKTSDGKTLMDSQVQNLVNAMAGFAPPPAGHTTLSPKYQSQLGSVIAANWQ